MNVEIKFYKYLSFNYHLGSFLSIKKCIIREYNLTEVQFEKLLWRANRVLLYKRELDINKTLNIDNQLLAIIEDNFRRQDGYFYSEIVEILEANNIPKKPLDRKKIREKRNEVQLAMNTALYPKKNPELDRKKHANRYYNSGTYFMDGY